MTKLTSKKRSQLPDASFALPRERKYPIKTKSGAPDKSHAANAKARAQQQYNKGNISRATLQQIDATANKILQSNAHGKKK